jgi:hypothetical protein
VTSTTITAQDQHDHVDKFLFLIDPHGSFFKVGTLIFEEARRDPQAMKQTLWRLQVWADSALIDDATEELAIHFRRSRSPRNSRDTLLALGYLGALEALEIQSATGRPLDTIRRRLRSVDE